MTVWFHLVELVLGLYVVAVAAGILVYVAGRCAGWRPAPVPGQVAIPATLAEHLSAPRWAVLLAAAPAGVVLLWLAGGLTVPWLLAVTVGVVGLVAATPARISLGSGWCWLLLLAALGLVVLALPTLRVVALVDALLLVFLAVGLVVLVLRIGFRLPPLPGGLSGSMVTPALAGAAGSGAWSASPASPSSPAALPPAAAPVTGSGLARSVEDRPARYHLALPAAPLAVLDQVTARVVGQPAAEAAWLTLLEEDRAFFSPGSTRPLAVLHVGPPSCGKVAFAQALAAALGTTVQVGDGSHLVAMLAALAPEVAAGRGPGVVVVRQAESLPPAALDAVTELVQGRRRTWLHTLFVFVSEALTPAPDQPEPALRETLIGAGLDRRLVLGMRRVIPFQVLAPWALAGVAARLLVDEAGQAGAAVSAIAPEALAAVVGAIPPVARDQGAAGVAYGIAAVVGRQFDAAKAGGWRCLAITHGPGGVLVAHDDSQEATMPGSFDLSKVTNLQRVQDLMAQRSGGARKVVDEGQLLAALTDRVRGQEEALGLIARAVVVGYAKEKRQRPVATVLLVGPPGTGKTQTAKTLCGHLFGSEADLVTLNGAEYKHPGEALTKLIGVGAAYQGTVQGGTLTRPMFGKRERVVLFDEIEKMHPEVYDAFLSLLQDGYVTEQGSNKRADFTGAVVVLTCNLDHEKCGEIHRGFSDHDQRVAAFKEHFNARGFMRPEILDRIPDLIYFQPLAPAVLVEIAGLAINDLVESFGVHLRWIAPEALDDLVASVTSTGSGGGVRQMQQTVERRIGADLAALKQRRVERVAILQRAGRLVAVDAAEVPEAVDG